MMKTRPARTGTPYTLALASIVLATAGASLIAADSPMWGGTPSRNMVNLNETGIVSEWDLETGRNIRWSAQLGSQTYGNPVIHEGKVFRRHEQCARTRSNA
jgi:hypothetical protein